MSREKDEDTIRSSIAEYLTMVASVGERQEDEIEIVYEDEDIWLTQKMIAKVFGVDVRTVALHLKKIFADHELLEEEVTRKYTITGADGKRYVSNHHNLKTMISLGLRISDEKSILFRRWATRVLKSYIIKGWVIDDERLQRGTYITDRYFKEQLERINEIRASKRNFYQKITDLFATAIDYDKNAKSAMRFYARVQNKIHIAIHGKTATGLIVSRASSEKENMGLTNWQDAPNGKIKKTDLMNAQNYFTEKESEQLYRIINAYMDFAEKKAKEKTPLTMEDWETRFNSFIALFEHNLLRDPARVTSIIAQTHVETEFEKFRKIQDRKYRSDFDEYLEEFFSKAKSKKAVEENVETEQASS